MPTYLYTCPVHGEITLWHSIHEDHPRIHDSCGQALVRVYTPPLLSAGALSSKRAKVAAANRREQVLDRDMAAYKRLRRQGIQPARIDGCAELESRAETRMEIEYGKVLPNNVSTVRETIHRLEDMGLSSPLKPKTDPISRKELPDG